jgi:hypothetical protein
MSRADVACATRRLVPPRWFGEGGVGRELFLDLPQERQRRRGRPAPKVAEGESESRL